MSASPAKKRGRKADGKKDEEASPKKKKALDSRFGGKTEEEIMQLFLPDHLKKDLDIVFIGINPGLLSAHLGHHYCNANNHFWPCMYESGLIPKKLTYKEDAECLDYGIGFTNIVPRTTRSSNDLTRKEIKEWSGVMIERMKELTPLVACFNGKGIYEIFTGKKCEVGVQTERLPDTDIVVYVMPSTSGRAASHPRRVDKLKFFYELKELRDRLKLQHGKTSTKDAAYAQLGTANELPPGSDHTPKVSDSTSNDLTTSAASGKVPAITTTTGIALPVASTAVTAPPRMAVNPPLHGLSNISMPVSTVSQLVLIPQLSQGLQSASASASSSQPTAPGP